MRVTTIKIEFDDEYEQSFVEDNIAFTIEDKDEDELWTEFEIYSYEPDPNDIAKELRRVMTAYKNKRRN